MLVRRRFMDMPFGQIHYREAGTSDLPPLMLLHASPGSSKQLEFLIEKLGQQFHVIAPDTMGNGDSTPANQEQPEIIDYANAMIAFSDQLGLGKCTFMAPILEHVLLSVWPCMKGDVLTVSYWMGSAFTLQNP